MERTPTPAPAEPDRLDALARAVRAHQARLLDDERATHDICEIDALERRDFRRELLHCALWAYFDESERMRAAVSARDA